MSRFITADTHLGHKGALRWRPQFTSVEEMDDFIIERWNSVVGMRDVVIHVGDFVWPSVGEKGHRRYRERLNGRIILVPGNHDHKKAVMWMGIEAMPMVHIIKDDGVHVVLCHYPLVTWPQKHYGYVHCHGHCHGLLGDAQGRMDVGIDVPASGYAPWPFSQTTKDLHTKWTKIRGMLGNAG